MEEEADFKLSKLTKKLLLFAIGAFVFSLYMFFISIINTNEGGNEKFKEQGAVFYTLNLANPMNIFKNIDLVYWIAALIIFILILLTFISIIIYARIKKYKKIQVENQPNIDYVNYSPQNNKVIELLEEGNKNLERKEYANARITYHKIKQWYDFHADPTKEIYFKIMKFYERITKEEI